MLSKFFLRPVVGVLGFQNFVSLFQCGDFGNSPFTLDTQGGGIGQGGKQFNQRR